MKAQAKTVLPDRMKKVKRYLDAYERIQAFKAEHYELFQEFAQLLQDHNDALEDAEMDVRAQGVNCGPFTICGEVSKVDVARLHDELGEEDFLKVGGIIETKPVYTIDKRKFESLAESGSIPKEVVEVVYSKTLKFKTPSKAELP